MGKTLNRVHVVGSPFPLSTRKLPLWSPTAILFSV